MRYTRRSTDPVAPLQHPLRAPARQALRHPLQAPVRQAVRHRRRAPMRRAVRHRRRALRHYCGLGCPRLSVGGGLVGHPRVGGRAAFRLDGVVTRIRYAGLVSPNAGIVAPIGYRAGPGVDEAWRESVPSAIEQIVARCTATPDDGNVARHHAIVRDALVRGALVWCDLRTRKTRCHAQEQPEQTVGGQWPEHGLNPVRAARAAQGRSCTPAPESPQLRTAGWALFTARSREHARTRL